MTTQPSMEGSIVTSDEGRVQPKEGDGGDASSCGYPSETLQGKSKPLTKTQKRNLRKRQIQEAAGAIPKPSAEEDSKLKRLLADLIPSPQAVKIAKMSREVSPTRTFAKAIQQNMLAVVKDGFPTSKLSEEEYNRLYGDMTDLIDLIPRERPLPKINSTNYIIGAMIISYSGKDTEEWIRTSVQNNTTILAGITLKVLDMSEVPKDVKMTFRTSDTYTKDPKKLLKRLNKYNWKLKTDNWRVLNYVSETQSAHWTFMVDIESADAIQTAGLCIYAGMDKGVFKILNDPNEQEDEKDEAKKTGEESCSSQKEHGDDSIIIKAPTEGEAKDAETSIQASTTIPTVTVMTVEESCSSQKENGDDSLIIKAPSDHF